MSNEAKVISQIVDNLQGHGYRALSGIDRINDFYAITVHQNGTEIVHENIPGFEVPMLETRPIIIAGGAGRIALTFTTNADLDSLEVAESLRLRHGLGLGIPRIKGRVYPTIQTALHTGTIINYPSRLTPLTCSYMRDTVLVEAGINVSNLDIEPVIKEASSVGSFRLVSFGAGFSKPLLNGARALERLASGTV